MRSVVHLLLLLSFCQSLTHKDQLKSINKIKHSFSLFFSHPQLIAELQTSVCDSKEEAVRLQKAMEKQLEEMNARWDEERRTVTHRADQANKVSVCQ